MTTRTMRLSVAVLAIALLTGWVAPDDRALLDATRRGDVTAVKALLKDGADPNAAEGDGLTALHLAAQEGNLDITKVLLGAKANVEAKTRIGAYTPLHLASGSGHLLVVRALLDAGANPGAVTTTTGVTPLHLAAKAIDGAPVVRVLLEKGAPVNARESRSGQTALMFAAAAGRAATVSELLSHRADAGLQTEVVDVVERLAVDKEAQQRLRDATAELQKSHPGGATKTLAREEEQKAIAAQRAFLSSKEELGKVAEKFDPKSLSAPTTLYKDGPEFLTLPKEMMVGKTGGMAALHYAARDGQIEAAEALLDGGANIDEVAGDGCSALLLALLNGRFDLAMRLIQRGANVNLATTTDGVSPLFAVLQTQWALKFTSQPQPRAQENERSQHLEVLAALLDRGADPNVRLKTQLWHWEWEGKMGLDITGATPLWRAAFAQDVEAMKLLVAHGADASIPTAFGPMGLRPRRTPDGRQQEDSGLPHIPEGTPNMYPIHAAAGGGWLGLGAFQLNSEPNNFLPAVKYLVEEHGADVNLPDAWGYTPLHYAAVRGGNDLIEYLVSKGADVTKLSRLGQSPVDLARGGMGGFFLRTAYPETVKLLSGMGSPFKCLSLHFRDTNTWCEGSGVPPFDEATVFEVQTAR
jgi:uncharacterized protein